MNIKEKLEIAKQYISNNELTKALKILKGSIYLKIDAFLKEQIYFEIGKIYMMLNENKKSAIYLSKISKKIGIHYKNEKNNKKDILNSNVQFIPKNKYNKNNQISKIKKNKNIGRNEIELDMVDNDGADATSELTLESDEFIWEIINSIKK